ncbi:MAG TPA: DUF2442 domain-containing protein [Spirochaetota bacterium]|nr:DUF2442 domain-containing protein [Spirochaetota bacterium]
MNVIKVEPIKPSILKITFSTNEIKYFDVSPYWNSSFFKELQNWDYFKLAKVSGRTVEWPHEQDIAPETLYIESSSEISGIKQLVES